MTGSKNGGLAAVSPPGVEKRCIPAIVGQDACLIARSGPGALPRKPARYPSHFLGLAIPGGSAFELSQPLKSLLNAEVPVALGSDGPTNPYLNILFATLHVDNPAEAITREQAVTAYTIASALVCLLAAVPGR